jgi:hypothetical protein
MIITPPRRLCESLLDRQRGVTNVNMHPCKTLFVYVKYKLKTGKMLLFCIDCFH